MESLIDPSYETISAERTWRYFTEELSDGKSIEVKCNLCNVMFPDSPGILTYLTRHLNFVHKNEIIEDDIYPEFGIDTNIETYGSENVFPDCQQHFNYFDGGKNCIKTSLTREYFTINNNSKAKCKICSKALSYNPRSHFNLSRHLREVHFDYFSSLNLDFISSTHKKSNRDIHSWSGETGLKLIKTNPYFENINKILENDFELKKYFKLENESLVCIKCSEVFNVCDEVLLKEHLQIYHSKWQVLCSENINSNLKDNNSKIAEDKIDLVNKSMLTDMFPIKKLKITEKYKNIWKYCSQSLSSSNITCNFCFRVFTYSSKIKWNIYRHLFYKHSLQMDKDDFELFKNNNPSLRGNKLLLEKKVADSFSSLKAALMVPKKLNLEVKTPSPQKKDFINSPKTTSLSKIKNTLKNSKPKKAFVVNPSQTSSNCVKYDSDEEYDHIKTKKKFIDKIGRTWSHFTKVHLGKAICNICHMSIHYFGNGGDVLNKHLDDYHVKKDKNLENSYSLKNCNIENETDTNKSAIKKGDQPMSNNKNLYNNPKKLTIEEDNRKIYSTFSENEHKVWMFFTKTDNGIAKCQLCLKLILYNDKIFYLILHLHQTHSVISIPLPNNENIVSDKEKVLAAVHLSPKKSLQNRIVMQNVDLNTLNESLWVKQQLLKKSKGINLWTYYSQLNQKDHAKCKICDKFLSYKGGYTYNLHRHLCNVHNIKLPKREDEVKKQLNKGDIWSYYTQITQDYALCKICNKQLSHKGGRFSNLERHVSNVHKIKTSKIKSGIPKIDDSGSKNIKTVKNVKILHFCKSKKNILSFFAKIHRDSLKCKLCKKHIFCRGLYIKRLMNHLWSVHINKFMTFNNKNIKLIPKEIENVETSKIIKGCMKNTVINSLNNCNTSDENIVVLKNNSKAQIVKQPIKSSKRTGVITSNKTVTDFKCNEADNSPIKNSSSQDQIIKHSNQIVQFSQTNEKSLPIVLKNSTDKKCATTKSSDSKLTNILYNKNNIHNLETKDIWRFFVKVGKSKVQCVICNDQKNLDREITDLKRHLSSFHKNRNSFLKNNTFDNEISPNKIQMLKRLSTKSVKYKCKLCFKRLICKNISEQLKLIKHLKVHNKELLGEDNLMLVKYSDKNYNLKNKNVNDNNQIVDNIVVNKALNRYFKRITILKNKCKICCKFVSSKIKCTHLVNGGFGISYGLGKKRCLVNDDKKRTGNSNYNIQFNLPLNKCNACDIISKKKGFCCHSIKDLIVDRFKDTSEYGVDNSVLKPMTDNSEIKREFQISNTPTKIICDSNKKMKSIEKFFNINPGNSLSNSLLKTLDKSPTIAALKAKHDIKDESKIINLNKSIVLNHDIKHQVNRSYSLSSCEVVQEEVIINSVENIDRIRNNTSVYINNSDFKQSVNLQSLLVNILINKNIICFVNLKGDKQFAECNLCKKCLLLRKPIIRNFISHLYFKHKNEILERLYN